jgi:hypothetical protein
VEWLRLSRLEAVEPYEQVMAGEQVGLHGLARVERGTIMDMAVVCAHPRLDSR